MAHMLKSDPLINSLSYNSPEQNTHEKHLATASCPYFGRWLTSLYRSLISCKFGKKLFKSSGDLSRNAV